MDIVKQKFEGMGAEVVVTETDRVNRLQVDVQGKQFRIRVNSDLDLAVIDYRPKDRHLLLMAKGEVSGGFPAEKIKILCGHDERHWFSSQVSTNAANVLDAKKRLIPRVVRAAVRKKGVKDITKRKTEAFLRQGEWFFTPSPRTKVPDNQIVRNEPLLVSNRRGGNKPHMAEECYRYGGTAVSVPAILMSQRKQIPRDERDRLNAGLTADEKKKAIKTYPFLAKVSWHGFTRGATVYVRGKIRHPDHATLNLRGWHRVTLNEEIRGQHSVFLD
jgi:hypothetical protein